MVRCGRLNVKKLDLLDLLDLLNLLIQLNLLVSLDLLDLLVLRIILTGGGSGGHIFPLIAVAQELKIKAQKHNLPFVEFLYLGPEIEDGAMKEAMEKEEIVLGSIKAGKVRRYFSVQNFIDPFRTFAGIIQSFWILFRFMPDAVFSKGGYGAFPVVLVSWLFRIPVIIHESDTIPGLANRVCAPFAGRIAVGFTKTFDYFPKKKTAFLGNPMRAEIMGGSKEAAVQTFGLGEGVPVILVIGGSQGAERINDLILDALPYLSAKYQIIHQCGEKNFEEIKAFLEAMKEKQDFSRYHPTPFLKEELKDAYAAADLIVSRAGAGSIFEIAAVGKPSIIIPLPGSASEHQRENAYEYQKSGAAIVIEEKNLTPNMFSQTIDRLFEYPEKLAAMADAAVKFYTPGAAEKIVEEILELTGAII